MHVNDGSLPNMYWTISVVVFVLQFQILWSEFGHIEVRKAIEWLQH